MSKTIKTILAILAVWVTLGLIGAVVNRNYSASVSPEAQSNTFRNGFIVSCAEEAEKYWSSDKAESYCSCGYEELLEMYPDFATNEERINRILEDGYNKTEIKAVQECV